MNQQFWDKLPKDLQEKVSQAMKEATEFERKSTAEDDAKIMADLKNMQLSQKTWDFWIKWCTKSWMEKSYGRYLSTILWCNWWRFNQKKQLIQNN